MLRKELIVWGSEGFHYFLGGNLKLGNGRSSRQSSKKKRRRTHKSAGESRHNPKVGGDRWQDYDVMGKASSGEETHR